MPKSLSAAQARKTAAGEAKKPGRPKKITSSKEATCSTYVEEYISLQQRYADEGRKPPASEVTDIVNRCQQKYAEVHGNTPLDATSKADVFSSVDREGNPVDPVKACRAVLKNYICNQRTLHHTSDPHRLRSITIKEVDAMYDRQKRKLSEKQFFGVQYGKVFALEKAEAVANNALLPTVEEKRTANITTCSKVVNDAWDELSPEDQARVHDEWRAFYEKEG
jgi:hypothetical protein